jgi:hypothetical protein
LCGTPEFLRKFPPQRRIVNLSLSLLGADQRGIGDCANVYRLFVLAHAVREGVCYN